MKLIEDLNRASQSTLSRFHSRSRGCNGNGNNFATKEKCMEKCGSKFGADSWDVRDSGGGSDPFRELKAMSSIRLREDGRIWRYKRHLCVRSLGFLRSRTFCFSIANFRPHGANSYSSPVDCQVSTWTEWSACSVSCGSGGWATVS